MTLVRRTRSRHSERMSDGARAAYQSTYDASLSDPEGFWRVAAEAIAASWTDEVARFEPLRAAARLYA